MQQVDDVANLHIELLVTHMQTMHQHDHHVQRQHQHVNLIEHGVQHQRAIEVVQHIVLRHELVVNLLLELLVTHIIDVVLQR